ncbi:unnamed protein product [Rhizophagus irregularis]|nr:unnamed protein product [Rhizophagus irregularis]CAB5373816.1 unnamed protein product [Rhizophagus irregularis]
MSHNCSECDQCKIDKLPCQPCIKEQYQNQKKYENRSSGNKKIDELVKYVRPSLINTILFLEWIPYEDLEINEKDFAKGGYGTISLATWINGYVVRWNHKINQWHRQGKMKVVLKTMNNSDNISDDFIAELEAYFQCASRHLISYLGITQNPDTKNYAIVMEYAENDIKEKIMKWQSVLGWFPTEESRSDEEAKQFEEADDEKSKEDRRYRAGMYNPTPKSQEPSAVDQDCRELPDIVNK